MKCRGEGLGEGVGRAQRRATWVERQSASLPIGWATVHTVPQVSGRPPQQQQQPDLTFWQLGLGNWKGMQVQQPDHTGACRAQLGLSIYLHCSLSFQGWFKVGWLQAARQRPGKSPRGPSWHPGWPLSKRGPGQLDLRSVPCVESATCKSAARMAQAGLTWRHPGSTGLSRYATRGRRGR